MQNNVFEYFKNHNQSFSIYSDLIKKLSKLTKLKIKKRNSYEKVVVLCNKKNFAVISLLKENGELIDDAFRIAFQMPEEVKSKRLKVVPEHDPNDYVYYVVIQKEEDVDSQLIEWLRQSYENAK